MQTTQILSQTKKKRTLPYTSIFEISNYTLQQIDIIFRKEVRSRIGIQFTQKQGDMILYILENVAYPAHAGQYRDEGPAYIIHPIEVATEAALHGENATVICAALLHDTLEDTYLRFWTVHQLQQRFHSKTVEKLTELLSNIQNEKKLPINTYLQKLKKHPAAIRIKMYDRKVNLLSFGRMVRTEPERVLRKVNETRKKIIPLIAKHYVELSQEIETLNDKLEIRVNYALAVM